MLVRLSFAIFAVLTVGAWAVLGPGGAGAARAQDYDAGMAAYEAGDYGRAARIWDSLAAGGDPTAQYSLGKLYETGNIDLQRDYGRAVEWYRLAAAQGVAAAQNNLGLMYAQGRGVARDAGRAAELWSAAAKQNHPMAQFNLGLAYFRGQGVAENKREAETWFRRAAEMGLADAQYALGQVRLYGLTAEADRGEALAWYQLAAAQGHLKAREQAEILRREGVKPRMEAALDAPDASPSLAPAVQRKAQAPVPAPAPAPALTLDSAAIPPETTAPASTAIARPAAKPVAAPANPPAKQAPAKQAPAKQAPAKQAPAEQSVAGARTAPLKAEPAKAAPAMPTPSVQPAAEPAGTRTAPSAQIKTQVARAGVGTALSGAGGTVKVWLYSAKSEGEAVRYLRQFEAENGPLLAGVDGAVTPVQFDDGAVLYRVVAGDFESWSAGRRWCGSLNTKAPDTFCKVLSARGTAN